MRAVRRLGLDPGQAQRQRVEAKVQQQDRVDHLRRAQGSSGCVLLAQRPQTGLLGLLRQKQLAYQKHYHCEQRSGRSILRALSRNHGRVESQSRELPRTDQIVLG